MHRSAKLLGAVGVACIVAAGGSAYTAALTAPPSSASHIGFVSATVTGAAVDQINYTVDNTGTTVTAVTVIVSGDTSLQVLSIGFDIGVSPATDKSSVVACATGTYSGGTTKTTYQCDVTQGAPTINVAHRQAADISSVQLVLH
jgi:hypothetical protein